jgi:gliding motility-associated-like protein
MKKTVFIIFWGLQSCLSLAQNLIRNGDFESFTTCPTKDSQIKLAFPWSDPPLSVPAFVASGYYTADMGGYSSADYYNSCGFSYTQDFKNYNLAHSKKGYAAWAVTKNWFEYIMQPLEKPFKKKHLYYFSMYIKLLSFPAVNLSNLGIYFPSQELTDKDYREFTIAKIPQIRNHPDSFITNTSFWKEIKGRFVAEGNEKYVIIGCFDTNDQLRFISADPKAYNIAPNIPNYYGIDDVSLYDCSELVDLGENRTINCSSSIRLGADIEGATYRWQDGSTQPYFMAQKTGTYWVNVRWQDCQSTDSVQVRFESPPVFSLGKDTVLCQGTSLTLVSPVSGTNPQWSTGATSPSLRVEQTGIYTLETTLQGCKLRDTISIRFEKLSPLPRPESIICEGENLLWSVWSPEVLAYRWADGSNQSKLSISKPGTYWVQRKSNACEQTDSLTVSYEDCQLEIPNVITPNGDGKNDMWVWKGKTHSTWSVWVYNRWGHLVYANPDYANNWQGLESSGTYYYRIEKLGKGKTLSYQGFLQVLKE